MAKKTDGFTVVEIIIVLIIIGLLAGVTIPNFMKAKARAKEATEIQTMRQIANAYEQYFIQLKMDIATIGVRTIGPSGKDNWKTIGLRTCPVSVYDPRGNFTVGSVPGKEGPVIYVKSPGAEMPGTYTLESGYIPPRAQAK